MNRPSLSVIVCTHNPRPDYWTEMVAGLRRQTHPLDSWELVIVDNASTPPGIETSALSWHPNARVVPESQLGLTNARLRGIDETRGDLVVFVDDDNVLAADYLATAESIARQFSFLGAFGGNIAGRFERAPAPWALPYLRYLAIVEVTEPQWSNAIARNHCTPCGAGMCVRRSVAAAYARALRQDSTRRALDRVGESLSSGGDTDLALVACDIGLGVGLFPQLRVEHLMPAGRVQLDYLCDLVRENHRSQVILGALRGRPPSSVRSGRMERLLRFYQRLHLPQPVRRLEAAIDQGRAAGAEFLRQHPTIVPQVHSPSPSRAD